MLKVIHLWNVIFEDSQIENYTLTDDIDSLKIDIGPLIQRYITEEINFNNIIISTSNNSHNFSNIVIINSDETYKPRLEIFYSK